MTWGWVGKLVGGVIIFLGIPVGAVTFLRYSCRGGVTFFGGIDILSETDLSFANFSPPSAQLFHYKTPNFAPAHAAAHWLSNNRCYDFKIPLWNYNSITIIQQHLNTYAINLRTADLWHCRTSLSLSLPLTRITRDWFLCIIIMVLHSMFVRNPKSNTSVLVMYTPLHVGRRWSW